MVAHQVQERVAIGELPGAGQGVPVAARLGLLHEVQRGVQARGGARERVAIAGADDDADLADSGVQHLLEADAQHRLARAVMVHDRLQREVPLVPASGGDHGLRNLHGIYPRNVSRLCQNPRRSATSRRARRGAAPFAFGLQSGAPSRYS